MTEDRSIGADDAVQRASRTLGEVDRRIAARDEDVDAIENAADDAGAVHWAEMDGDVIARLAAGDVLATNRELSQRSLRDFLY